MASATYLRKRQQRISERASARGARGNEVKRQLMQERGADLEVVGRIETFGIFGEHVIEVLACDDPLHVWMRVDGDLRRPRTVRGVYKILSEWIFNRGTKTE